MQFGGQTKARSGSGNQRFASIPSANIPRSVFDRSHTHKTTFDGGFLIPVYVDEALPGDTINFSADFFARMAPTALQKPVMDEVYLDFFCFSVPIRLIWDNWQKFMGEQDDPGDSIDFTVPIMTSPVGGYGAGDLQDYMGIPTLVTGLEHNALHTRAYSLIYKEWFRDQNLVDSPVVDKDDGPDTPGDYVVRRRGKRHDYFTACLVAPQKGTAVALPLGSTAPVVGDGAAPTYRSDVNPTNVSTLQVNYSTGTNDPVVTDASATVPGVYDLTWADPNLQADLSSATAATINAIREAFQVQRLLERDARGGTRYTEIVRSHFGVISPDARLQRPEYLGGGTTMVNFHPVPQTSESGTTDQGNLSSFGTAATRTMGFTKSFTEHCVLIGLVSARAKLTYQQGLNRMWSRQTRYDFYFPAFAHLGEMEVLSKEIYADGSANDDDVFGYQERWAEYRYKPSLITGKFRSNDPASLDVWHLSQDFAARPLLNQTFIEENPPFDRVVAVPAEPHFLLDCGFNIRHVRPMPTYSVPGLIDHF